MMKVSLDGHIISILLLVSFVTLMRRVASVGKDQNCFGPTITRGHCFDTLKWCSQITLGFIRAVTHYAEMIETSRFRIVVNVSSSDFDTI